jgi:mono/diheme cytochrome c family protein
MSRFLRIVAVLAAVAIAAAAAYYHWRTKNLGSVQRGWKVAHANGCFTCHGDGGHRGMPDPGHGLEDVPPFSGGLITMYASSVGEIREWIQDGMPKRIRNDPEQLKLREKAIILMPAWRDLIQGRDLDDLVAYVKAASDFETPKDEHAEEGRQVALKFGCFNCHGPQGRGAMPNVRAFKGYIPSWDGPDFPELVQNDQELREWILEGGSKRLEGNRVARFFLQRQPVKMPAYKGYVTPDELDRLVDYFHWLRLHPY